jgi:hypothetical protein
MAGPAKTLARRATLALALVASLALGALAPAAGAAGQKPDQGKKEAKAPAFQHFVACGTGHKPKASHRCPLRGQEGAYFRARRSDVHYTVCLRFPGGKTLCAKHQEAERNTLYVNAVHSSRVGVHRVTWFVDGKRVGRFYFRTKR